MLYWSILSMPTTMALFCGRDWYWSMNKEPSYSWYVGIPFGSYLLTPATWCQILYETHGFRTGCVSYWEGIICIYVSIYLYMYLYACVSVYIIYIYIAKRLLFRWLDLPDGWFCGTSLAHHQIAGYSTQMSSHGYGCWILCWYWNPIFGWLNHNVLLMIYLMFFWINHAKSSYCVVKKNLCVSC